MPTVFPSEAMFRIKWIWTQSLLNNYAFSLTRSWMHLVIPDYSPFQLSCICPYPTISLILYSIITTELQNIYCTLLLPRFYMFPKGKSWLSSSAIITAVWNATLGLLSWPQHNWRLYFQCRNNREKPPVSWQNFDGLVLIELNVKLTVINRVRRSDHRELKSHLLNKQVNTSKEILVYVCMQL